MRRILKGLSLVTILVVPSIASAQSNCAARDRVVKTLEEDYSEAFAGGGLQSATKIIEVWFSEEHGTWTVLMTRPDGTSCVMASGTDWRESLPGAARPVGIPG